jgi:hypothetical protein
MGRSSKPRKPYRKKCQANRVAAFEVLHKSHVVSQVVANFDVPLDEDDQRTLVISYGISLDRMVKGQAVITDLENLGLMCNVSVVLCEQKIGKQYLDDVVQAQLALWRAYKRMVAGKTAGLDAIGIQAVRRAYDLHTQQVELAGQGLLVAAEREVSRRASNGDVIFDESYLQPQAA